MEGAFLAWLHFYLVRKLKAMFVASFFEPADASTRTAAIIASAAALLLSGVILMAPVLSLSLHQSYDTLFELRKHIRQNTEREANHSSLIREVEEGLRRQLLWYQRLNPSYFATWLTSIFVLALVAMYSAINAWADRDAFNYALSFLLASCFLSVLFSIISIFFFAITKPGITKLRLFIRYFDRDMRPASGSPPASPQPGI
jgi:hypothetical protein